LATVRVWVPGCSTGQEAYSIAMSLLEYFDDKPRRPPIQIFATDISEPTSLDKARAGIYPDNIEAEVSPERLRRFFQKEDHHYRIDKSIRDLCVFARQNLTVDPPFSHVDLVSCRNVLIYLSLPLQKRVLPTFHYALNSPGFLVLGSSESIGDHTDLFEGTDRLNKIYAKKPAVNRPLIHFAPEDYHSAGYFTEKRGMAPGATPIDFQREADRLLLGRYAPPGVLVNANLDIIQFRGRTGQYLELPAGEPTTNLLKMAREGLFLELRSAIEEARNQHRPVRRDGLRVRAGGDGGESRSVNLEVVPLRPLAGRETCFLVLFNDAAGPETETSAATPGAAREPRSHQEEEREVAQLRRELTGIKEYLQSLLEQQDAANEELRSANEEILSSNEELQSTNEELETAKEELQSTNEELSTVNEQLQNQNIELTELTDDLSNLLASMAIPMVMVDADLHIRRYTEAARPAINLRPSDIGRPLSDLKSNLDIPDLDDLIRDVMDKAQLREREVRDLDGRWHRLCLHPYRTTDHKIGGAVILLIDIDDIKKNAEAIRESEARFRLLADSAPVLIWLKGADDGESVNKAFRKFVGAGSEAKLQGEVWSHYVHPEDYDAFVKNYRGAMSQRVPFEATFRMRRHDGEYRWMKSLGVPRLSDSGTFMGYVGSSIDITEIQTATAALENRVEELKEADRQKNEFVALLAHEMRNPLAPISNAVEILRNFNNAEPRVQRSSLNIIDREVKQMARMLEDLLDVSRLTHHRLDLRKQPLEIAKLLHEAIEASQPYLDEKNHRLEIALAGEDLWVDVDRARLEQVFSNLLINAAKFTREGGSIRLAAHRENDQVVVSVSDNGVGMSDEFLRRAFEMFSQGERTAGGGGLGIGLTLVKNLVDLHGGSVQAHSEGINRGSVFFVRLPLVQAPHEAKPQPEATPRPAQARKKLLIVDDNKMQASSLSMLLEMDGHEVKTAEDGPSALALLADFVPDYALIDIGLPRGVSGYDVARRIREQPRFAQAVLIAQTGWGRDEDRERSRAAGFDYHLVKPIDHQRLQRILDGREPRR
jgi:two-component system CheB/CheR fusion protein